MSANDDNGRDLEDAAAEGQLPGVEAADTAEEEGRDPSGTDDAMTDDGQSTDDTANDGQTDDDAPAGGVVMGAVNQH
jgi:hypothetical protein